MVKSLMVVFMGMGESDTKLFEHHYRPDESKTIISIMFADEKDPIRTCRIWLIQLSSTLEQHRRSAGGCSCNFLQVSMQVRETIRKTGEHWRLKHASWHHKKSTEMEWCHHRIFKSLEALTVGWWFQWDSCGQSESEESWRIRVVFTSRRRFWGIFCTNDKSKSRFFFKERLLGEWLVPS